MAGKFMLRLLLFLSPLLAAVLVELFVLPVDAFTFRCWEALRVRHRNPILRGYFYPHCDIEKISEGDLGFRTSYARPKRIRFRTDRFGYRNTPPVTESPEYVLVGDSFFAGGSLTQDDTPATQLGRLLGQAVYAYAPADLKEFFGESRFCNQPPRVVVFGVAERSLRSLPPVTPVVPSAPVIDNRVLTEAAILVDRLRKRPALNAIRARIRERADRYARRLFGQPPALPYRMGVVESSDKDMLFYRGKSALRQADPAELQGLIARLLEYRDAANALGAAFIFVPVPNKESIYYDRLGADAPPDFLPALIAEARKAGIAAADLQTPFLETGDRTQLYQVDDTHWNARGAALACEVIAAEIVKIRQENRTDAPGSVR